jgi:hypothetical protein
MGILHLLSHSGKNYPGMTVLLLIDFNIFINVIPLSSYPKKTKILHTRRNMLDSPAAVHIRLLLWIIADILLRRPNIRRARGAIIEKREGDDLNWQGKRRRNWI